MKIIITIIFACLFNLILNTLYIDQIGEEFLRGDANYYLLDSYYYWHLGAIINAMPSNGILLEKAFDVSPTINSIGVVAVAGIFNKALWVIYFLPFLFLIAYIYLFRINFKQTALVVALVSTILIGTAPLPFLISKESLLYIGIILIVRSGLSENFFRKISGVIFGILFVTIGRYEVLGFLLISYILCITRPIVKFMILTIGFVSVLYYFNIFYDFALIAEKVAISQDNDFCGGITNVACLNSGATVMTVLGARLLLSFFLPLKWLFAMFESFSYLDQFSQFWSRFSQGLFALLALRWFFLLRKYNNNKNLSILNGKLSNFGFWFFVTYSLFYMLVVFQQPTRQVQFALSVFMIAVTFDAIRLIRRTDITS